METATISDKFQIDISPKACKHHLSMKGHTYSDSLAHSSD